VALGVRCDGLLDIQYTLYFIFYTFYAASHFEHRYLYYIRYYIL